MIAKIKAPTGFRFKTVVQSQYRTEIQLFDTEKYKRSDYYARYPIGSVSLVRDPDNGFFRTHALLSYDYHHRGLGVLMYAKAIQWALSHGERVSSSGRSSDMARRLWKSKSLRKYFMIKHLPNQLYKNDVFNKERYDRWYAYEKPGR